jgi:hypothetical protein
VLGPVLALVRVSFPVLVLSSLSPPVVVAAAAAAVVLVVALAVVVAGFVAAAAPAFAVAPGPDAVVAFVAPAAARWSASVEKEEDPAVF